MFHPRQTPVSAALQRAARAWLAAAAAAGAALPPAAQELAIDPFASGVRWSAAPSPGFDWMPRAVALTPDGEFAWSGATLAHPHLALRATAALNAEQAALFEGPPLTGAIGVIPVAVGAGPEELFAAVQFPAPDAAHRRTEVVRYDARLAAQGLAPFAPLWTRILPVQENGPALLAADAQGGLVAAIHSPAQASVHLEWLDPSSGAPLAALALAGGSLGALAMSQGGARVALSAGSELWVVEADGTVAHHETLAAQTSCLALSADGTTLAVGGFGAARVLQEGAQGFATVASVTSEASHIAAVAALDAHGTSAAVGFWNFATGVDVRIAWIEVPSGVWLQDLTLAGTPGPQNFPEELVLTADGARLCVGLWGQAGSEPELLLLARGEAAPLAALDLPGSALALALSSDGSRAAVCQKGAHANQFSTTGSLVLFDTGERELQLVGPLKSGGALELALLHPGQTSALFGVGQPAERALVLSGVEGALLLALSAPLAVFAVAADLAGRADLALALPASAALAGVTLAAQGIAVAPAWLAFSSQRVSLTVF
jgi:hypothetical protein